MTADDASNLGATDTVMRPKPSAEAPPPGEPWTVLRMILWSADYLTTKGVERGRLDAEYLLADTLGLDRLQLYLQFDRPLIAEELEAYRPRLRRRAAREPLQYVLGTAAFRHIELAVDAGVLIPRPETEGLVSVVLEWAAGREGPLRVLDVGTGSGAIALALATERANTQCVATDSSQAALAVAAANGHALGVDIDWRVGSFYEPVHQGERFEVVVSNPPYVLDGERDELAPEVRDHEPAGALFSGPDGLDAVRALLAGAASVVAPNGLLALEIGSGQGSTVLALAQQLEGFECARLYQDLSSRDRYVTLTRTAGP
jgi:release factor glutamine methyltransferase